MIGELQIPHPDGELEQFQRRESDVIVAWLLARERLGVKAPRTCPSPVGEVIMRRKGIIYEGHNRYARGEKKDRKRLYSGFVPH